MNHYLACDLGAESGRLMLGSLDANRLTLEELHRFPNDPVSAGGSLHWNICGLIDQLKTGLRKAASRGLHYSSISTDSWGVDYLLMDNSGRILEPVFHYRDVRTARGVQRAHALIPWEEIFAETGIQFMPLNTLYQLAAEVPGRLQSVRQILLIGDAFNHVLSGRAVCEESMASTSQLYNPRTRSWSTALLDRLGFETRLLPPIVPSGTVLGPLRAPLAAETGLSEIPVIASCSHDTGAAVASVPATGGSWGYLSSGTWSLMGVELPQPIINDQCRQLNFTNEVGYGGSIRLLKNIIGLWLVQECRRDWARQGQDLDYAKLTELAAGAPAFATMLNPTDPMFLGLGDMPARIAKGCRKAGCIPPPGPGATVRCILESLALLYRVTLRQIETIIERRVETLHIVGGGSRNRLLNQFTANALQIPVVAGPVEATAAGNVLVQAVALGHLPSLAAARRVVRDSFELAVFEPTDAAAWNEASARFEALLCQG